jgi:hypothetical protein
MPDTLADQAGAALRRSDPLRALEGDALARSLLPPDAPEAPGGPLGHLRARDPRARLETAAGLLHGARAGEATLPEEHPAPRRRPPLP